MLPSFTSTLPTGRETGSFVALDLGGSTLRIAVVDLRPALVRQGRQPARLAIGAPSTPHSAVDAMPQLNEIMRVVARQSWLVDDRVKKLPAPEFFDWIAERVGVVLDTAAAHNEIQGSASHAFAPVSLGVTWSFPVEPTSAASGKVQQMGKGYEQWRTIQGTDLRAHFEAAFRRRGLCVRMTSLMNDTEATLLSHAYANPATRLSLIWGTGINAAVYLPLSAVGLGKLRDRPVEWTCSAKAVVVNTEISMFGKDLLLLSPADMQLDANSNQPGFQPLEQLSSGRYLGEICRLILVEAIARGELLHGNLPKGMDRPYSFDTSICSAFEDPNPTKGPEALLAAFPCTLTKADSASIKAICTAISSRSASLIGTMLFTLHRMQRALDEEDKAAPPDPAVPIAIAFCGAVPEKHTTALRKAQAVLDLLVELHHAAAHMDGVGAPVVKRRLVLEPADDSGLLGAAVGAAMQMFAADADTGLRAPLVVSKL